MEVAWGRFLSFFEQSDVGVGGVGTGGEVSLAQRLSLVPQVGDEQLERVLPHVRRGLPVPHRALLEDDLPGLRQLRLQ